MAKLCTSMCSVLTKAAIGNLNQRKIYTVVDVLQEDPKKLASISKLDFRDIVMLRQTLVMNYSPLPRQGLNLYTDLISNCSFIPTGIDNLDSLLSGGLLTGNVFELCGLCGSGKSQLYLTLVTNIALKTSKVVHYIDTKFDFSGQRVHSILEAKECNEEIIGNTMEKILVTRVHSFSGLYSFLYHLKNQLVREPGSFRVVFVESLPAIFLQYMGHQKSDGLGLLNCLASLLKYIAHEHHVCIMLVNLATTWVEEEVSTPLDPVAETSTSSTSYDVKPVLGKYWAHVPSTRLCIEKCDLPNERKITVLKSAHLAVGSSCKVTLTSVGVE